MKPRHAQPHGICTSVFAPPRKVTRLEECFFYHTIDLPDYGTVSGIWDIRSHVDRYIGGVDVRGKRILEMGTASGFLGIEMERRGAEVIGYDLSDDHDWDLVPFNGSPSVSLAAWSKAHIRMLNNSWWLVHRACQSSARIVYGTAYEVPEEIGPVDMATFGCLLLHLRDPFQALASAARLVRDTIVVTEHDVHWNEFQLLPLNTAAPRRFRGRRERLLRLLHKLLGDSEWSQREELLQTMQVRLRNLESLPLTRFLPDHRSGQSPETWWAFRPQTLCAMLGVLGFPFTTVTSHEGPLWNGVPQKLYTIVARRET